MSHTKEQLELHFIVFIWGFTAILGALISTPALGIVWYRMLLASIAIATYALLRKKKIRLPLKSTLILMGVGLITAAHWVFFFTAIKVSNVSVTLACLSSTTLFVSIIEPLVFRSRIVAYEIFIGLIIIFALYLIFQFEGSYRLGIAFSLLAALAAAIFGVLNAKLVRNIDPVNISGYEMLGGVIGISLFIPLWIWISGGSLMELFVFNINDIVYLLILSIICTAYAFLASVRIMKVLSPFTVALTINMEPVYGIVLAFFIFGEKERMSTEFYLGALIILFAILLNTIIKSRKLKLR